MKIKDVRRFEAAILWMILSASCLSIFSLFVKIGLKEVSIWSLTFLRFFVPLLLLLPFLEWKEMLNKALDLRIQIWRAIAVSIGQFSMIYYLTRATLLDATIMWGTGPIFIPIIARLFYGVKVPALTWLSIFISFVGVMFILKPDRGMIDPFIIFGLISGIAMAISQTLYGINIEKGNPKENLFFLLLFCSIVAFIPFLLAESQDFDLHFDVVQIFAVLGIAIATIGNQIFRGMAYRRAVPSLLMPFLYISVVLSAFFDWTIYHIYPDSWAVVGFILVLLGSYLKWAWGRGLV